MKTYSAPWSASVIIITTLVTALCVGLSIHMLGHAGSPHPWLGLLPLALILGSALFTIRGYTLTPDSLLVHRLFWPTRLPLAGLQSAQFVPNAMRWSLRTFGNGGLFSVSGLFWNRTFGSYRAFVTNPRRSVVLRFPGRTVMVSPSAPGEFVRDLGVAAEEP